MSFSVSEWSWRARLMSDWHCKRVDLKVVCGLQPRKRHASCARCSQSDTRGCLSGFIAITLEFVHLARLCERHNKTVKKLLEIRHYFSFFHPLQISWKDQKQPVSSSSSLRLSPVPAEDADMSECLTDKQFDVISSNSCSDLNPTNSRKLCIYQGLLLAVD